MDIDLAGRTDNALDHVAELVGEVCAISVDSDGIEFNRASIEVSRIKKDADYEGVRVRFHATLARARIPMQLDIGFGDVISPGPTEIEYPTLLDFPAPVLRAYPKETVVAEKLEALTALGVLNSRMKDYYDLALLSRMYPFEGDRLAKAINRSRAEPNSRLARFQYQPQGGVGTGFYLGNKEKVEKDIVDRERTSTRGSSAVRGEEEFAKPTPSLGMSAAPSPDARDAGRKIH